MTNQSSWRSIVTAAAPLFLAMSATAAIAHAQPATDRPPATALERVMVTTSDVVQKDFYKVAISPTGASLLDNTIEAAVIRRLNSPTAAPVRGMRVSFSEVGNATDLIVFVDEDELAALLTAIDAMFEQARIWKGTKRDGYSELSIDTRGSFTIGFYQDGLKQQAFTRGGLIVSRWEHFSINDLARYRVAIDDVRALLKTK